MWRRIATIVMGAVILAGGLFSAYNTFALFTSIFGTGLDGYFWSAAGLALFDIGALGWLLHFAHSAQGNAQRAIAAICGIACLMLTLCAAGVHVLLVQELVTVPAWAGQVAVTSILVALAINLIGAAANHMADPAVQRDMRQQAMNDEKAEAIEKAQMSVFREALRQTEARVAQTAGLISDRLSGEFATDANREMLAMTAGGDNSNRWAVKAQWNADAERESELVEAKPSANGTQRRARKEAHNPKG
jgi:hypothetical protein